MKRVLVPLMLIAAAFAGGTYYARRTAAAKPVKAERKILYWVDPMHPAYKSDKPGIAPDCGMKLEPVYADSPAPEGTISVDAEKQQLIGVRYGQAEYTTGTQTIRAAGRVTLDETRVSHVHSRTEGWIEQVLVGVTGDLVKEGQPLLTIYSPELLATAQEYVLALKAKEIMKHSTMRAAMDDSDSLIEAARKRLELWALSEQQIDEIRRTGKPAAHVTLYSPAAGYVLSRNAFPNQKIMPDTDLYTIVDLSRVWVMANVFEYEIPQVRIGQTALISLPYSGGRKYRARVSYIQPQVDAATRTIPVRLELDNPGLQLKPEMFVDVEIATPQPRRLTVPAAAVLDSGLKKTVFIDRGDGHFEEREVRTGARTADRIEIVSGLGAGERIVTSGNFLLNSESQLRTKQ